MMRREFLKRAGLSAAACAVGGCLREEADNAGRPVAKKRPNVLLVLADDLGHGDMSCYGSQDIRTPVADQLSAEGARMTCYYAAAPECTPTRTALLTGRYQHRVGGLECAIGTGNVGRYDDAIRLANAHDLGLPAEEVSLARLLKRAGYETAAFGKWHLGYERKFFPDRHGFDHFVGVLGGNCDYFHHCEADGLRTLYRGDQPIRSEEYMTDLITHEAERFLRRPAGSPRRPFFLYVPYTAPHSPYQGPGDRRPQPLRPEQFDKGTRAKYVEMVQYMDACVGKLLVALRETGQLDSTLVLYVSDNGGDPRGSNAPYSGRKSSLYEGGIRVPCIARWPGVLPAGRTWDRPAITMDLTASIAAAAGAGPPSGRPFDGQDVLRQIAEGRPGSPRPLFWRARRGDRTWRAVRDGSLKYLSRQDGPELGEWLFDLSADPGEQNDRLAARPNDTRRLKALLEEWQREVRPKR